MSESKNPLNYDHEIFLKRYDLETEQGWIEAGKDINAYVEELTLEDILNTNGLDIEKCRTPGNVRHRSFLAKLNEAGNDPINCMGFSDQARDRSIFTAYQELGGVSFYENGEIFALVDGNRKASMFVVADKQNLRVDNVEEDLTNGTKQKTTVAKARESGIYIYIV